MTVLMPTVAFARAVYYSKDDGTGESYTWLIPLADQLKWVQVFTDKVSFGTNAQIAVIVEPAGDNGVNWARARRSSARPAPPARCTP
jgi:hypothetical protein